MFEISWLCDGSFLEDRFPRREDAEDFAASLRDLDVTFVMVEIGT